MMKTSAGRGLLLILASVGLWGACSNHKTSPILNTICSDQNPCKAPLKCIEGFCKQLCTDPAQCPDEMVCSSQGFCATSCQNSDDCADDEKCFAGICEPVCIDKDQDGFGKNCPLGDDCDDNDPTIHPGAIEICGDGKDNNCNGQIDESGCGCVYGSKTYCYTGPAGTDGHGICHGGESECGADLNPGPCVGEQVPTDEVCNGFDDNCNGVIDDGVTNACGNCGPVPQEICGDGIDNNCDGTIDEGCNLICCRKPGEACKCNYNHQCDPLLGEEGCDTCDYACLCQTSDTLCHCRPPEKQPCYTGPAWTAGVGACKAGLHDCVPVVGVEGKYVWTECVGQVLPTTECAGGVADGIDNDCNGQIDETCCVPGTQNIPCYTGPAGTQNKGICHGGTATCGSNGTLGECVGQQLPTNEVCNGLDDNCNGLIDDGVANACGGCGPVPQEICGDGLDNNCNGQVDEDCGCKVGDTSIQGGETTKCYRGPVQTAGVGECKWGTMTCQNGEFWSQCVGDVLPQPELCDGKDNDCDGIIDNNGCGGCIAETFVDCYDGPAGTENKGICHGGKAFCHIDGTLGPCEGEQLPIDEVCNGVDDNCNGLPDDGVLSPCGKCPGDPCYEEIWDTPGQCGVLETCGAGTLPVVCPPPASSTGTDCITLGEGTAQTPFIYLAVYNHNEIAKLDIVTGQRIWIKPSLGRDPSRTAVPLDHSTVWVANRAVFQGGYNDPQYSNAVHLDADGNLMCRADTPYVARGIAIDGDGNVWVGTWYSNPSGYSDPYATPPINVPAGKLLYKISGSNDDIDHTKTPPRCKILSVINLSTPTNYLSNNDDADSGIYGLAVDGKKFLWTASNPKLQIDTTNPTSIYSIPVVNNSFYGITIDRNDDVWLGGAYGNNGNGGVLHKVHCNRDANGKCTSSTTTNSAISGITGVAVDDQNYIWAAQPGNNRLVKINPACIGINSNSCREVMCYANSYRPDTTNPQPRGVAVDTNGKIWATNRYARSDGAVYVDRFNPAGCTGNGYPSPTVITPEYSFLVDQKTASDAQNPEVYTYSDMTGYQLQNITTRNAHWIQHFDSGYLTPIWASAVFGGLIPQYTSISLSFVAADTEAGLSTAPAGQKCGPYAVTYPNLEPFTVDITSKPECAGLNNHRWLMVDVLLSTTQNGVKPIFRDLHVTWTRPLTLP